MARRRSQSTRTVDPKAGASSLTERWLNALRNNPIIAAVIVIATAVGAVIGFWDRASDFYGAHLEVPVSVAAVNVSAGNDGLIDEQMMTCRWDDKNVRTFSSSGASKENHAVPLDFVLTSTSDQDVIVTGVDVKVSTADSVAGGGPGIIVPNHTYLIELEHDEGTQSFPLNPPYRIPPKGTGSFTIAFQPKEEGIGLCWIMRVAFNTNLGAASSEEFSLIMSRFAHW